MTHNFSISYTNLVYNCLKQLQESQVLSSSLSFDNISVEAPKESTHGDLSTNAAMVLAKPAGLAPRILAEKITPLLQQQPFVTSVSIAGPGFINFTLSNEYWQSFIPLILSQNLDYGNSTIGQGKRANVEYVSANPTGPMHAGHGRNAVFGDAIAALLTKTGYTVTREYYINDAGNQIDVLARSAHLRYRQALGERIAGEAFEGLYPGDYLVDIGQRFADQYGHQFVNQNEQQWLPLFRKETVAAMMELIRDDLAALGVKMDTFTSEQAIVDKGTVDTILAILQDKGDLYEGVLEKPKGHDDNDWEPRPQTLFRASAYGDDVDRALKKSDGTWTYFASDIAYHYDKFQRGGELIIDVLGADHAGYLKRIKAATKAVTNGKAEIDVCVSQLVNLLENGTPIRMSKRSGNFIRLRDVIDRVGKDVTRFIMLTRHHDMPIDFDFAKVLEQSKDNPVFYVQYAHARCHSVLRHGLTQFPNAFDSVNLDLKVLNDTTELEIMKLLAFWPRFLEKAALAREPHRITNYLQDLAAVFHSLWNKGKDHTELRFIDPNNASLTAARLNLIKAVATVLASGLTLFGITPVEEMRQ